MTILTAHRPARTLGSPSTSAVVAGRALGVPIEKIRAPATGWPSAEITRQLSTCVPRLKFCGRLTATFASSATTAPSATGSPSGPMRRTTSGDTGSLNVKISAAGARASTAPSAGSAFSSEACAQACGACASAASSATISARQRTAADASHLGQQLQRRSGLGIIAGRFSRGRNLDPAMNTLLAFLHYREIERLSRFEIAGNESAEDELVVISV